MVANRYKADFHTSICGRRPEAIAAEFGVVSILGTPVLRYKENVLYVIKDWRLHTKSPCTFWEPDPTPLRAQLSTQCHQDEVCCVGVQLCRKLVSRESCVGVQLYGSLREYMAHFRYNLVTTKNSSYTVYMCDAHVERRRPVPP